MITSKQSKEEKILKAAEQVFFNSGYANAKMEEIAQASGYSKVTLYSYFASKADLYMAITYRSLQYLIDELYECLNQSKGMNGLNSFMKLAESFLNFSITKRNYSDLLLNYLGIVSRSVAGEKTDQLTEALKKSIYYRKVRDIQNVSMNISTEEISRGQKDGSITKSISPWLLHHMMWSMIIGYSKINYRPQEETFIHVNNQEWRQLILATLQSLCLGNVPLK